MGWHKIELSSHQMANGETEQIQNLIDIVWSALGYQKGFAVFHSKISVQSGVIYLSPAASKACELIIKKYNGTRCPKPSQDDVGLFLGHNSDKNMLS